MLVGVQLDSGVLDPAHALRHDRRFLAPTPGKVGDPTPDECPQRLVIVLAGRLDESDVFLSGPAQARGDADPCGTTSHDDDSMVHRAPLRALP